jgi:7-cyano-7-deazaguanine synthase
MTTSLKAVVLLSGGLDSSTTLAIASQQGYTPYALSFSYGQRQNIELQAAAKLAKRHQCPEHKIIDVDLRGGSALTGDSPVPKGRALHTISDGIAPTYVPARNTVFLAHALSWAEMLGAFDIFIGVNSLDYSGYPDCRPEFIHAFEVMANLATGAAVTQKGRFTIQTPLLHMTKAEIIRKGLALGVDYSITHSCYDPSNGLACGFCDACVLRKKGFSEAKVDDPTIYIHTKSHKPQETQIA